jgi:hypothetical protein
MIMEIINSKSKQFDVNYYTNNKDNLPEFSHKYKEPWRSTDYFCPNCGIKSVWLRDDGGDFYAQEQHICISCDHTFHLPDGVKKCSNVQDSQRLAELRDNTTTKEVD